MYFDICDTSTKFLMSLVNDNLYYALMQAGKFTVNFEQVKIKNLMSEVCDLIGV